MPDVLKEAQGNFFFIRHFLLDQNDFLVREYMIYIQRFENDARLGDYYVAYISGDKLYSLPAAHGSSDDAAIIRYLSSVIKP